MKLIIATTVVIASCLLFIAGPTSAAEKVLSTTVKPLSDEFGNSPNSRFFFNSGDPCANSLYTMMGIADGKCSIQCFLQAGQQQGGYCEGGACQCNVIQ